VKISALCDVDKNNLEKRMAEFGGNGYSDFNRMLSEEKLDAVWICTPPSVRQSPILACIKHGVPVFCEKPVERDLRRAERINALIRKHHGKVQIGYVFRSMPLVIKLKSLMADDRIHLVQSFYGCNVSLKKSLPPWFYDKEKSGGALIDQATHNLDLLRMLIGEVVTVGGMSANPVRKKKKGYTIEEVFALNFLFASKAAGSHVHTWVGDGWRNEIVLSGEKRIYRLNSGKGTLSVEEDGKQTIYSQDGGSIYEHQNMIFLDMVKSGRWERNPCDYHDGLLTLKLTLACDTVSSRMK